jgi:transcriptional regulator with XRE-family HTH domain
MSPFAVLLRQLRESRGLIQKDLAIHIGYEQSYISGLETGKKGIPHRDFIERFTRGLNLNAEEQEQLSRAMRVSRRQLVMPDTTRPEEYELVHRLSQQLGQLAPEQLTLLRLAVSWPTSVAEPQRTEPRPLGRAYPREEGRAM